jgi:hypothetical protein
MNKWYGKVGYSETVETDPGVWEQLETIREYYGDVKRNNTRWSTNPESTNDNLTINTQISIIADPFAIEKFYSMKWIEFLGTKWKVTSVEPQFPRLLLTLGENYNG